jgi:ankyrin repeat protein
MLEIHEYVLPSCLAAEGGHGYFAKFFLDKGADIGIRSTGRETAMDIAENNGHHEIVDLLLRAGVD